jgi:hypothetical protein
LGTYPTIAALEERENKESIIKNTNESECTTCMFFHTKNSNYCAVRTFFVFVVSPTHCDADMHASRTQGTSTFVHLFLTIMINLRERVERERRMSYFLFFSFLFFSFLFFSSLTGGAWKRWIALIRNRSLTNVGRMRGRGKGDRKKRFLFQNQRTGGNLGD